MSRTLGTVVRGVRAPIFREGDSVVDITVSTVLNALAENNITARDGDVVAVTESVVARCQGNYATCEQIAEDVRARTGGKTVGVAFPILSRNRFSLLLRGIAMGAEKVVLLLSYPSDEVGNHLVSLDQLDEAGIDPWHDVLSLEQFRAAFGEVVHPFTGVDYVAYYKSIIEEAGAQAEIVFANRVQTVLDYTDTVFGQVYEGMDVVDVIAKKSNNPRWAWDCYRRFIQMYSDVVMEVGKKYFEQLIDAMKEKKGVTQDVELSAEDLKELAMQFKAEYKSKIGSDFPTDPKEQLIGAIKAVFRSWDNPRANAYRRDNDIPYSWGTAVNVQSMAFGNMGDDCGTGVAFTRDPATGEKKLMGEFLTNAQGEDVVAGVRTPMPIAEMAEKFPEAYDEFVKVCNILEGHYRDMQDMEFTVEHGKLYMLQCRNGKRTAPAALKIACDLVDEGMIDEKKAVSMIDPRNLDTLLHPQFDAAVLKKAPAIAKALPASPGAACGKIVFSAEDAKEWKERGEKVVLVRLETSPEDIEGMKASQGILTVRGGMTSHAAVVARGMGKCCVSGCGEINMDEENKKFELAGKTYHEGDFISIDGSTGNIYDGIIPTVDATIGGEFGRVMAWADKYRRLGVRTNADNPHDTEQAVKFGAEGIGLCRTEHMFFEADRIPAIREMICSDTVEQREKALAKLLPMQQGDFEGIYEAMEGCPVTIRFLDPPLHEFVPTEEADIELLAKDMGKTVVRILVMSRSRRFSSEMLPAPSRTIGL